MSLTWYNDSLNESQKLAVKTCLQCPSIGIVHGPPGTGKTSTLVELILQALQLQQKMLVCAPSNIAVDTILIRVTQALKRIKGKTSRDADEPVPGIIRLGHPARVVHSVLPYTLDHRINDDDGTEIVQDVRKEVDSLRTQLKQSYSRSRHRSSTSSDTASMTRQEIKSTLRASRKEVIAREREIVRRILQHAQIVFTTCVGAGSSLLRNTDFDLVLIDEAAQGLESACWIPILLGKKVVLAGDHRQLPPTIKSREAERRGLGITLFERIISDVRYEPICVLLDVQYRMNDLISQWASREMYDGRVHSHETVSMHTLAGLLPASPSPVLSDVEAAESFPVLYLVDSSGCGMAEDTAEIASGVSHRNVHEAHLVVGHVVTLLQAGVLPHDIGVITPYNAQVDVLRGLLGEIDIAPLSPSSVEVKTVDGFQGGEKEAIVLSLVRSNDRRDVGFLGDRRRINVAVTRARRHLAVFCDSATCAADPFLRTLLDYLHEKGDVMCAEDVVAEQAADGYRGPSVLPAIAGRRGGGGLSGAGKPKARAKAKARGKAGEGSPAGTTTASGKESGGQQVSLDPFAVLLSASFTSLRTGQALPPGVEGVTSYLPRHGDDVSRVLVFPASLSAFQRSRVHAEADLHGLWHASVGEGAARQVHVALMPPPSKAVEEEGEEVKEEVVVMEEVVVKEEVVVMEEVVVKEEEEVVVVAPPTNGKRGGKAATGDMARPVPSAGQAGGKGGTASKQHKKEPVKDDVDDDDLLLQLAIAENQRLAEQSRYRLKGTTAMPNYDKELAKQKLRSKLADSQDARRAHVPDSQDDRTSGQSSSSSNSGRRNKTVKKPVPNFGGGVLGRK